MDPGHYLPRPLPDALRGLADLALDLRWSWNHSADALWESVDPELWNATGNPWLILESISRDRLEVLAHDDEFLAELKRLVDRRDAYTSDASWYAEEHAGSLRGIAYFSMEFGLSEALPIYSGGLGILAGDYLKTASDLGVPVVGIGLLFQQGYFRQALDAQGEQLAFYPPNDPAMLPVLPLRDGNGGWLRLAIELPGRTLYLRAWQAQVGRVMLYLLDSNHPLNAPGDRSITAELYGGGSELRLQQEIVLGIGGWRLLRALDIDCDVCHLNEGHAAFAVLERARDFMEQSGQPFETALRCTRAGNIFTTHTPVEAGFDRFAPALFRQYFHEFAAGIDRSTDALLSLGRSGSERDGTGEPFNMAYLALRGSAAVNGVSQLHGVVSRRIFQPLFPGWPREDIPVGHVTNGVHMPSWDSAPADALWTEACGKSRWLGTLDSLEENLRRLSDAELWNFRRAGREVLVQAVRARTSRQHAARGASAGRVTECGEWLDPNTLTIGFARRFATYKRPNLLLHDPERLKRLLTNSERPVQLIIAGKAHPQDEEGKRMVRAWAEYMRRPDLRGRVVFVEDYDMAIATELVQGVDLWLNTPLRPWEASGTSGMKVLVNGGLNLSELDGWWSEAFVPEVGWALGDRQERGHDPGWDAKEAEDLYAVLEHEVIPAFYNRDDHGIPTAWVGMMRESMARLTPSFSSNRMVRDYTERYYLQLAADFRSRAEANGGKAAQIEAWLEGLAHHWPALHFGNLNVHENDESHEFSVQVYLDELDPDAVEVQLYAEPLEGEGAPTRITMARSHPLTGAVNGFVFTAKAPASRPAEHYTPRIIPSRQWARIPLEAGFILWYR